MDPKDEVEQLEKSIAKKDSEIALLKKADSAITKIQEKKSQKLDIEELSNLESQLNEPS